jgi:hypothetical protein
MTKDTIKAVLASYGRTALVAVISVYLAMGGEIDLQALLYAAVAAVAGPAMRAANPHDTAFGRLEAPDHLEEH